MTTTTRTRPHATRPTSRHTLASVTRPTLNAPTGTHAAGGATRHTDTAPARPTTDRLFVDLTSPWAYLAHLRFGPEGGPTWVPVQRPTSIPRTGLKGGGPDREDLERALQAARAIATAEDDLPARVPGVLPHPRTVVAAYAEAVDLGRGDAVRDVLLDAYWRDGKDIGDPEVLRRILPPVVVEEGVLCTGDPRREFGYLVSPAREPLTNAAYHLMAAWQQQWEDLGCPGPVALVSADGSVRTDPAALLP